MYDEQLLSVDNLHVSRSEWIIECLDTDNGVLHHQSHSYMESTTFNCQNLSNHMSIRLSLSVLHNPSYTVAAQQIKRIPLLRQTIFSLYHVT